MSDMLLSAASTDRRKRRRYRLPGKPQLAWMLAGSETLAVALALIFGAGFYAPFAVLASLVYLPLAYHNWYQFISRPTPSLVTPVHAASTWTLALLAAAMLMLIVDREMTTTRMITTLVWGMAGFYLLRTTATAFVMRLLKGGQLQLERVALVGSSEDIRSFLQRGRIWQYGLQPSMLLPIETLAPSEALSAFLQRCVASNCTRLLFIANGRGEAAEAVSDLCKRYAVDVAFTESPEDGFDPQKGRTIAARPIGFTGLVLKRVFDLTCAGLALLTLSPLLLLVALAIRLESPGPALFKQERMGFNGRSFMIYKFRSMRVMEAGNAMKQAQKDDNRITRVGAFLRKTSIDELPQLLNVLKGDMSLIGPRPHAISHDSEMERIVAQYAHRNRLKPGISGWAQVNGFRGDTSTVEKIEGRVQHDLYYIENWSLLLDIRIIFLTVFSRKTRQNAY